VIQLHVLMIVMDMEYVSMGFVIVMMDIVDNIVIYHHVLIVVHTMGSVIKALVSVILIILVLIVVSNNV